jgi:nucleotide-binding universal stress UspA family protein
MRQCKRILCPVDFSQFSKAALEEAISLAKGLGSELCILHAYQSPAFVLPLSGYVGPTADMITQIRKQLDHELEALAATARAQNIETEVLLIDGVPHTSIVEQAKEWHADLIVMGTHGRTGIAHALAGSVAERVVRLAPCAVLVTRSES